MIQSPIVGSSVTTTTIGSASATVDVIKFDDILRFAAGDYVEIDSEIVKVLAIGIGSTNNVKVTVHDLEQTWKIIQTDLWWQN